MSADSDRLAELKVSVPDEYRAHFSRDLIRGSHNLGSIFNFDDAGLVEILESYPRNRMRVWTTGTEPVNFKSWQSVDTTGLTGTEIFECLRKGKLWINLQRIDLVNFRFKAASQRLYAQLVEQCPGFAPLYIHSYLLISSPGTVVYLHLDAYENMLWVVRGGKEFHLFPPADRRMVSLESMEDICAGADDFFQYDAEYEKFGRVENLHPGDVMTWAQNSPHWIRNNDDINVGLGTFHGTAIGQKRVTNYLASRFFRERLRWLHGDVCHGALLTETRQLIFRALRKTFNQTSAPKTQFWAQYRLDPDARDGIRPLVNGAVLTEYSRLNSAW